MTRHVTHLQAHVLGDYYAVAEIARSNAATVREGGPARRPPGRPARHRSPAYCIPGDFQMPQPAHPITSGPRTEPTRMFGATSESGTVRNRFLFSSAARACAHAMSSGPHSVAIAAPLHSNLLEYPYEG